MKKVILTIIVYFCVQLGATESTTHEKEIFGVGRFIIIRSEKGFQATDLKNTSGWHKRAISAMEEISDWEQFKS